MGDHVREQQREEHANIGDVRGKKVFVFDDSGNQITNFGSSATVDFGVAVLDAGEEYIGLATVDLGAAVLDAGEAYIGLATVDVGNTVTVDLAGNNDVSINAGEAYIGLATVDLGSSLPAGSNAIGKLSANSGVDIGDVDVTSISAGENYVGLVTVDIGAQNGVDIEGTTKTIVHVPVDISLASITTLASITNTFYITNVLLSSNSTVRVTLRSGATHLNGNASIGITLFPGGGFVENGSVDSPLYQGVAAGGDIILEKWEDDALVAEIGGHITYYEE